MITDRTMKTLLFVIALGLWVNVVSTWMRPTPVLAQNEVALAEIARHTKNIATDTSQMVIILSRPR
jgi:hypothetical protein